MSNRRILSLWFPRLAAERLLRQARGTVDQPFAVVEETGNMQTLASLSPEASNAGLRVGQPLRDARAMCPTLLTRLANPQAETAFLMSLRRWAGKFSPWVSDAPPAALMIDLTGCAHLFGGEVALLDQVEQDCAELGLTVQAGIADTPGAAWALARFVGRRSQSARSGDAIDQEAYATRSRAVKRRHWERGGAAPQTVTSNTGTARIAPSGQSRTALGPLPIAALRLSPATVTQLTRLGLRRVSDVLGQPRATLARRFGQELMLRLDQAMGMAPEPISPAKPPLFFAARLTLPEPIGLEDDLIAGIDRLLPPLCAKLKEKGHGARRVRLQVFLCDHSGQSIEIGLARPTAIPDKLRRLLIMKLSEIDAGPGIDMMRLHAHVTEPVQSHQHKGHMSATSQAQTRMTGETALEDLISKIVARVGLEAITRLHPADSHIPEKSAQILAAAWSDPARDWPKRAKVPRPLVMFSPEPVTVSRPNTATLPDALRWRRREMTVNAASGPERIAPEWWLDDPAWRTGQRDYWRIETNTGDRLWVYFAYGNTMSPGWFCHGQFA
jgi:protein ImuB